MNRKRVRLLVEVDLDPVPGWGHDPVDWEAWLQNVLPDHYHGTAELLPDDAEVFVP